MRRVSVAATVVGLAALGGGWFALGAAGQDRGPAVVKPALASAVATETAKLPPLPTHTHAQVVQPVAGVGDAAAAATPTATPDSGLTDPTRAPTHAASPTIHGMHVADSAGASAVTKAIALGNGVALPPLDAPEAVKQIISAGNTIARTPYIWGGGHGKWLDHGYDCSGSVSFVLASAGLLNAPETSGQLESFGAPGPGKWVTIYASGVHVFLYVAGVRFDTGAQSVTGSRWANNGRSTAGFTVRHPVGL